MYKIAFYPYTKLKQNVGKYNIKAFPPATLVWTFSYTHAYRDMLRIGYDNAMEV